MNFDEYTERRNTECIKWDGYKGNFGVDHDLLPMWIADMDFKSPQPVIDALVQRARHGIFGYVYKTDAFYETICAWVERHYERHIAKESIIFTPGVIPGYTIAIQAFTNPGDGILIQTPVYYPFMDSIRNNGRAIVNNQLRPAGDHYEIDFDDLEAKASADSTKMMILCSPHNPVGRVWTKAELERIAEICVRHDVLLVSDEIHGDIVMKGHKHLSIAGLSKEIAARTITTYAPSKTFNLAGLQTAYMVIENPVLRADFQRQLNRNRVYHINDFGSVAIQAAYTHGDDYLNELRAYLEGNIDYMQNFISTKLKKLKMYRPQGTYLVWVDFRGTGLTDEEMTEAMLNKARIAVDFGKWFGPGGELHGRFNVGCPRSLVEDAMQRLERTFA